MRIGVDYRMLSAGRATVHRGMGRYTQQQLREVLRLDGSDEFVLFCREDADTADILPEIAAAPNVSIAWLPAVAGRTWEDLNRPADVLRATVELQRSLVEHEVDVFHATTPSYLEDLVPSRLDVCPLVVTHYDLIPYLFPRHYLVHGPVHRSLYLRSLDLLRQADRVVAISQHVRREALDHLGVPLSRIHVAYPVADPCFRRLPEEERERILSPVRERLGLDGELLLCVSHLHHAKNLLTLFEAYGRLPVPLQRRLPLVLAGHLEAGDEASVRQWARERKIEDGLVLPGFLADRELVALYNAATMVVHPSRYEGFGLPVLEAMRCGAAVIAGSASSLPEVAGDAGLLFDPEDPLALAQAIEALAGDPSLRRELGERAIERAALFRPEDLGRNTLEIYREAADASSSEGPPERVRLALWTPLPPLESGIADYSVELLHELVRWAAVEVFVDDGYLPDPGVAGLAPVHHHQAFPLRERRRPFDAILYQMGASFFHLYMLEPLLRWPGIVTLHDLSLAAMLHRSLDIWGRAEELWRGHLAGESAEVVAELRRIESGDPAQRGGLLEKLFNRHPFLGRIAQASLALVVHMPKVREDLESLYPQARAFSFAMGVEDPAASLAPEPGKDVRSELGIAPGALVAGIFGNADPVKRIESVVQALARLSPEMPDAVVLVVGSFYDPDYREGLRRLASALGVGARFHLLGRVPRREFYRLLLACDVVVNLRHPFRQQMSATFMRAIAAGKPVLVSEIAEWGHFPASFCLRVAAGEGEVETLSRHLLSLARDPEQRRAMGQAARRFYLEQATPAQMADGYRRVLEEVMGRQIVEPREMEERAIAERSLPDNGVAEEEDLVDQGQAPAEEIPAGAELEDSSAAGLATLFARWDAVRARSAVDEAQGEAAWKRWARFPLRTFARIRSLGVSWDRQRDLFRALIDRQNALERRLHASEEARDVLAGELAELGRSSVDPRIDELHGRLGDVLGAVNEIRVMFATLRDRQDSLRVRQSRLEMGHAALQERLKGTEASSSPPTSIPLTPRDVADFFVELERGLPEEDRPGAVEISLQDARAEDLLLAGRRHFGRRMSSAGPHYRAPNDLWVHIDFTADWNRPILLENAAARLQPGGRFLLVTAPGSGAPPQHPELVLGEDRQVPLRSGGPVRVLGWVKA